MRGLMLLLCGLVLLGVKQAPHKDKGFRVQGEIG